MQRRRKNTSVTTGIFGNCVFCWVRPEAIYNEDPRANLELVELQERGCAKKTSCVLQLQ
jgi:hypothetical protein